MAGSVLETTRFKGSMNLLTTETGELPNYCINGVPLDVAGTLVVEVSTNYTATVNDDVIIATGPITVTLFPVADSVKTLTIKSNITGGTVTVDGDGSETIEGALTNSVTLGTSITISRSAAGWLII